MSDFDPLDLGGIERRKKAQEDNARFSAEQHAESVKWICSTKQGRRYLHHLLERLGVFRSSFTGNSETFFREGMRNAGLMVMGDIHEHSLDSYPLMIEEARNERAANDFADDGRSNDH